MDRSLEDSIRLVKNSKLYKEFLAERQEILCHKWIESEKVGCDIGFERALFDWIVKYRSAWLDERRRLLLAHSASRIGPKPEVLQSSSWFGYFLPDHVPDKGLSV